MAFAEGRVLAKPAKPRLGNFTMLRPRFTLRVVLAVMTIVAVVAWQGSIVLKRKQYLRVVRTFTLAAMERTNQDWTDGNHRREYAPNFLRRLLETRISR